MAAKATKVETTRIPDFPSPEPWDSADWTLLLTNSAIGGGIGLGAMSLIATEPTGFGLALSATAGAFGSSLAYFCGRKFAAERANTARILLHAATEGSEAYSILRLLKPVLPERKEDASFLRKLWERQKEVFQGLRNGPILVVEPTSQQAVAALQDNRAMEALLIALSSCLKWGFEEWKAEYGEDVAKASLASVLFVARSEGEGLISRSSLLIGLDGTKGS